VALAITLVLHGLFGLVVWHTGFGGFLRKIEPPKHTVASPVALRSVTGSTWNANRKVRPPGQKPPALAQSSPEQPQQPQPPEEKPEPEKMPKGTIVDVAPGNGQEPDENARFLAETNNRVEKETLSRDRTLNYRNAAPKPTTTVGENQHAPGHDAVEKPVIAGNEGKGQDEAEAAEGKAKAMFELPSVQQRDRLALRMDGFGQPMTNQEASDHVEGNSSRLRIQAGNSSDGEEVAGSLGKAGSRELRTLTPSAAALDRIIGAPASDVSPMDDVAEGDGTYLNTREWKHSSFFNRVKQNVGMVWDPTTIIRRRDPTGEVYLYKDRYTLLSVTLDANGGVKSVAVNRSSGVDFLDSEAIEAFRRAQPFPNPPPALQDEHGEIRFTFGFYLETNQGAMQLFR
jgi:TonB family protein